MKENSNPALRQNPLRHFSEHIREPEIAALVAIREPFVVNAKPA